MVYVPFSSGVTPYPEQRLNHCSSIALASVTGAVGVSSFWVLAQTQPRDPQQPRTADFPPA